MVKNPAEKILRESLAAGFPTTDGSESRSYHLNNRQPRKFPSKNNLTRRVQPSIQHGPVNAAEVSVEFKITVIEVRQARIFPEQPRLRCPSQNQHWSSCAVIGSAICIFCDTAAEFAKCDHPKGHRFRQVSWRNRDRRLPIQYSRKDGARTNKGDIQPKANVMRTLLFRP